MAEFHNFSKNVNNLSRAMRKTTQKCIIIIIQNITTYIIVYY